MKRSVGFVVGDENIYKAVDRWAYMDTDDGYRYIKKNEPTQPHCSFKRNI